MSDQQREIYGQKDRQADRQIDMQTDTKKQT